MTKKICPNCKSHNIGFTSSNREMPNDYCEDCKFNEFGTQGFNNFPEIEENRE